MSESEIHTRRLVLCAVWVASLGLPAILAGIYLIVSDDGMGPMRDPAFERSIEGMVISFGLLHAVLAIGVYRLNDWALGIATILIVVWCAMSGLCVIWSAMKNSFAGGILAFALFFANAVTFDWISTIRSSVDLYRRERGPRAFEPIMNQPIVSDREK